jgi:hypothetical protein
MNPLIGLSVRVPFADRNVQPRHSFFPVNLVKQITDLKRDSAVFEA